MRRRARWLALCTGAGAIGVVCAVTAPATTTGCTTHQCDADCTALGVSSFLQCHTDASPIGQVYQEGNDLVWESSPMDGPWLDFPGQRTYIFFWPPPFNQREPYDIQTFISTGQYAQTVPFSFVQGTGQLATISGVTPTAMAVQNASCAEYYLRVVAREHLPLVTLFGGFNGAGRNPETWTWNGTYWVEQQPLAFPPARSDAAMATLKGKVVLFGGTDGNAKLGDTWTWNGATWTCLLGTDKSCPPSTGAQAPSARSNAVMAALGNEIVLFGGDNGSNLLGDTWTFDGTSWTPQPISGPSARAYAAATVPPPPGGSAAHLVLFGGYDGTTRLDDTWILAWSDQTQPPSWTQSSATGPVARSDAAFASFDSGAVLFGGLSGLGALGDTWLWNDAATSWTQAQPASAPGRRRGAGTAAMSGKALLFGGTADGKAPLADTWEWGDGDWALRAAGGPSARFQAATSGP